jgi:hypothetical protein
MHKALFIFLGLLFISNDALAAAPKGSVQLPAGQFFESKNGNTVIFCGKVNGTWLSGKLVGRDRAFFLSVGEEIKNIVRSLKKLKGLKKKKVSANLSKLRKGKKANDEICVREGSLLDEKGNVPLPVATPTNTPLPNAPASTPTATPTPITNSDSFFLSNGDVTIAGKEVMGIPTNLSANLMRGREKYGGGDAGYGCMGCHSQEKRNSTYDRINRAIVDPTGPMYGIVRPMPPSDLADIVAYLNRFRIP